MPGVRSPLWPLAAALLGCVTTAGCASTWPATRDEVVQPVNKLVHKDYPKAFKFYDRETLRGAFAPEAADAAERDLALLARFATVDRSRHVIEGSTPVADGRLELDCILRLDGTDAERRRHTLIQRRRVACRLTEDGWRISAVEVLDEQDRVAEGPLSFVDEAKERGIDFVHASRGGIARDGTEWKFYPGSGLAAGDIDGDDRDDLLLVGGGALRLYRNAGEGRFEDVTEASGIAAPPAGELRSATFADLDNDGDADLFVGVMDGDNILYRNDGGGRFTDVIGASGIASTGETMSACFADFDRDGNLDIYIVNCDDLLQKDPEPIQDAKNARPNQLLLGNGDLTFRDVTEDSGAGHQGWAQAGAVADYDLDGDADILVACDFGYSALLRNNGDATFEEVTAEAGLDVRTAGMSVAWGDVDGDGYPDAFIGGMRSGSLWILDQPDFPLPGPTLFMPLIRPYVAAAIKEMMFGNRLFRNRGDGTFEEASERSGIVVSDWAFSGVFFDWDNDGLLDIYSANGFYSGPDTHDL